MKHIKENKEQKPIVAETAESEIKNTAVVPKLGKPDVKTGTIVKVVFLKDLKNFKEGKETIMEWSIAKALEKKGIVKLS